MSELLNRVRVDDGIVTPALPSIKRPDRTDKVDDAGLFAKQVMCLGSDVKGLVESLRRALFSGYAAAVAFFIFSAGPAFAINMAANSAAPAMIFLSGVLMSAATLGSRPGILTAMLACITYEYYFTTPIYSFEVDSPAEIVVLMTFPLVAFLTGGLAGRARDSAKKAEAGEIAASILYNASREISLIWDEANIRRQLAHHLATTADSPAIVWTASERYLDPPDLGGRHDLVREILSGELQMTRPEDFLASTSGWRARLLQDDDPSMGMAAWLSSGPRANDGDRLVNVLVDLAATAIVRARVGARKSELEVLTRTEKLRSALLSSVSHDFRTPLSVILASATSLRALSTELDVTTRDDLLATIQEETERLNGFVANLLHMAKLESGVIEPNQSIVDVAEVIDRTIQRLGRGRWQGRLTKSLRSMDMLVRGDPILLEHALGNVVENALRFSPIDQPVCIQGENKAEMVHIEVTDQGAGVEAQHLDRIFEKFYQCDSGRSDGAGAGLGLSIARGLAEAMHGSIVASNRDDSSGLKVTISFPRAA